MCFDGGFWRAFIKAERFSSPHPKFWSAAHSPQRERTIKKIFKYWKTPQTTAKINKNTACTIFNKSVFRLLMHKIRHNCINEFVKLCLRYTARDPRLRTIGAQTQNSRNNYGAELTGGHDKFIFKLFGCLPTTDTPLQQLLAAPLLFFVSSSQQTIIEIPQPQEQRPSIDSPITESVLCST